MSYQTDPFATKGISMQNRHILKLAIKLRATYRTYKSWRRTSSECKVLTDDGRVNPGLVKRIARDKYQPADDVMNRLIRDGAVVIHQRKQQPKMIWDMTTAELCDALNNRVLMPKVAPCFKKAFKQLGWKNIKVGAR
jgi:hypothetical protein